MPILAAADFLSTSVKNVRLTQQWIQAVPCFLIELMSLGGQSQPFFRRNFSPACGFDQNTGRKEHLPHLSAAPGSVDCHPRPLD